MRKFLITILLAGAAASPAVAQDHGRWHRDQQQSEGQPAKEDRSQAKEERRQAREQMRAEQSQQAPAPRFERQQQVQGEQRGGWDRSHFEGRGNVAPPQQQVVEQQRSYRGGYSGQAQQTGEVQRTYRGYSGFGQPPQAQQTQRSGSWARDRGSWSHDRDGDFRQREATQQQYRDRNRWASGGWNRDWRNDRRYDWRNYRDRHRSIFHIGVYYDPFGYSYRPFNIGYRLQRYYYGQQYWIDPAMYSLPYPPPGTQWVRYWNDALLVDIYSGEVVDVIHNFFW
jgi:Ni/Co efflux regulator RcnB